MKISADILQSLPTVEPQENVLTQTGQQRLAQLLAHKELANWARQFLEELANDPELGGEDLLASFFKEDNEPIIPRYMTKKNRSQETPSWLDRFFQRDDRSYPYLQGAWLRKGFLADDPVWLKRLLSLEEAKVAHMFLLTGNIVDYVFDPASGYCSVTQRLVDTFQEQKDGVIRVSLSQGITIEPISFKENIKEVWAEDYRFEPTQSLEGQICDLFSQLRSWLEEADLGNFRKGVAIIVENVHLFIPANHSMERSFLIDSLLNWSLSPTMFHQKRPPHCVVLMADYLEDVSSELRTRGGKIEQVLVERPSSPDARLKFLLALRASAGMGKTRVVHFSDNWGLDYEGNSVQPLQKLAEDTAGLTLMGIEDIIQQSLAEKKRLNKSHVMEAKRERLQQESEGLLEVIEPKLTLEKDFAGYDSLIERLREVVWAIENRGNPLIRSTIPMGILFLGPPGTGKTVAVEAIAGESQINMAKLGDFRGMYVGQSERNLSRLLALIESLHPVIIFMDELDQSEGYRGEGGDSGVSKRVFGKLLQFMSDTRHRGDILWIGASNRPDLIDAAMKRPGRFDLVLPFLLPDHSSRQALLKKLLEKKIKQQPVNNELSEQDYQELAEKTDGYSGAEIEGIIGELLRRMVQSKHEMRVTKALFDKVLEVYEPPKVKLNYHFMEDHALKEVRYRDLIPPIYLERLNQLREQEKKAIEASDPFQSRPNQPR